MKATQALIWMILKNRHLLKKYPQIQYHQTKEVVHLIFFN